MGLENSYRAIGRLGKKPELRFTKQDTPVCTINVACNETFKDASKKQQEVTTWVPHVCWGKRAETVCKYLDKGSLVATEGPLRQREYELEDGIKRYVQEVRVNSIKFLDPAPKGARAPEQGEVAKDGEVQPGVDDPISIPEDDIPF